MSKTWGYHGDSSLVLSSGSSQAIVRVIHSQFGTVRKFMSRDEDWGIQREGVVEEVVCELDIKESVGISQLCLLCGYHVSPGMGRHRQKIGYDKDAKNIQ